MGNWDVMEGVLDHTFVGLGIDSTDAGIGRAVLITEPIANLGYSRKSQSPSWIEGNAADKKNSYDGVAVRVLLCAIARLWN